MNVRKRKMTAKGLIRLKKFDTMPQGPNTAEVEYLYDIILASFKDIEFFSLELNTYRFQPW